ncbi:TetR family transcriptional regulator [Gordonia spumicola]|uniref:TetR family transcriptional regulator n=1 Tax=Gordonia spumicola TaxID=589161 RepID=A0A7I9VAN1_9ACTN|nr:TetR/AcrR family transcriptional regulator [Gordonia spumicola]GEE02436.1 TetR family transcriptional regulator [Gordonia spumicola]
MAYRRTESTRRTAQAKRDAVLGAARALIAESGFAAASVAAIAEDAQVSVGSVYSYFDNREALLAQVFRTAAEYEFAQVDAAVRAAGPDPLARLDALIGTFADRALRGRRMAWSLLFEPVIPAVDAERLRLRQWYREMGESIIADGVERSVFVSTDAPVAASAVMGAISEALVGALNPDTAPPSGPPVVLLDTIRDFCRRALGAPPVPSKENR